MLGAVVWREVELRHGLGALGASFRRAAHAGELVPPDPLLVARLAMAALVEAVELVGAGTDNGSSDRHGPTARRLRATRGMRGMTRSGPLSVRTWRHRRISHDTRRRAWVVRSTFRSRELSALCGRRGCDESGETTGLEQLGAIAQAQLQIKLAEEVPILARTRDVITTTCGVAGQGSLMARTFIERRHKRRLCGVQFARPGLSRFAKTSTMSVADGLVDAATCWTGAVELHQSLIRLSTTSAVRTRSSGASSTGCRASPRAGMTRCTPICADRPYRA